MTFFQIFWSYIFSNHRSLFVARVLLSCTIFDLNCLLSISGCQWECEQSLEPMGAAVCVWELCIDCEAEPVLHIIFARCTGEAAVRTGWWMDRLLRRRNLQPDVASAYQYHRCVCVDFILGLYGKQAYSEKSITKTYPIRVFFGSQ